MKRNPFSTAERRLILLAGCALIIASCATGTGPRYTAEYSPWALALTWTNRLDAERFESLELTLKPDRQGEDLKIDGETVHATYEHGKPDECPRLHRVEGTIRLVKLNAADVRALVDAVMHCPGTEPVALKGEFTFDVKVPP